MSTQVKAYDSAYPGSMVDRDDGYYLCRNDHKSLAAGLVELIASRDRELEDLRDTSDRLHTANVELVQELKNIAEANPLNWDAPLNDTASFRAWAQSRAQAAVAKHGVTS